MIASKDDCRLYRNGNSTNFFPYAVVANVFLELFTSTLIGITVSAQYVIFKLVVLHAGLNNSSQYMQINEIKINEQNQRNAYFFSRH